MLMVKLFEIDFVIEDGMLKLFISCLLDADSLQDEYNMSIIVWQ